MGVSVDSFRKRIRNKMADNEGRVESIDHLVHSVTEDSANLVDESVRKRKKSRTSPDHSFKEEENNVKKHKPYGRYAIRMYRRKLVFWL